MYVPNPLDNVVKVVAVLFAAAVEPVFVLNIPALNAAVFEIVPDELVVPTSNSPADVIRVRSVLPVIKYIKSEPAE